MNTTFTLTKASFKMFLRNRQAMFFTLFMPVIIMAIFGFIGFDSITKINLSIAAPETPAANALVEQLSTIEALTITRESTADAQAALAAGKRDAALILPDTFTTDGGAGPVEVTMLTNVAQPQQAGAAISIVQQFLNQITLQAQHVQPLFDLDVQEVNAKNVRYIDFLLPGIVAMAIMQMSVFSVAFVFADYKEKGILKRLIATPMRPYQFVTSNIIVRLVVALAQASILIALGVFLLHTQVVGSLWLVAIIVTLGSVMFLGMGFTISGLAKTVEAVPAIANIVVFPMLFLSGVFFPIESMPDWLAHIVTYFPLTHFAYGLRDVMANGETWSGVQADIFWMIGWAVLFILLALFTFRFEERRAG